MNGILDDWKDKLSTAKDSAGKFAKIVLDKTTNAVDITKLSLAKNEAEGKINKLYAKIGEAVFEQYKNGSEFDGIIGESLLEIEKLASDVEELKQQILSLKSTIVCPNCGQQNSKSDDFCSKCGTRLPVEEAAEEAKPETEDSEIEAKEAEEDGVVDVVSEEE